MPRITVLSLPDDERAALAKAAKPSPPYSFRLCCQAVLLKTDPRNKRTSLAIAQQLGCCEMSVNGWLKRYRGHGLPGLKVKPGRGRKPIPNTGTFNTSLTAAVTIWFMPCHASSRFSLS